MVQEERKRKEREEKERQIREEKDRLRRLQEGLGIKWQMMGRNEAPVYNRAYVTLCCKYTRY